MSEDSDKTDLISAKSPETFYSSELSGDVQNYYSLGIRELQAGRYDLAIGYLHRAIEIEPKQAEFYLQIGLSYKGLQGVEYAIPYFQKAQSLDSENPDICFQLGLAYSLQGQFTDAIACQEHALINKPAYAEAHNNLGYCHLSLGNADEAITSFRRAIEINPIYSRAHFNIGIACMAKGDVEQASLKFEETILVQPDLTVAHDSYLLSLLYLDNSPSHKQLVAARGYANQFEAPLIYKWQKHMNLSDPEKRLKIGYLSPDFYHHSVARFMLPVFTHHDREKFEIYAYTNGSKEDAVTMQIRSNVTNWVPCSDYSDDQLADKIRADRIDILVDLSGHTAGNRLQVFARKPAPVQVTYLGYPATTGLNAMDWRIVTSETDVAGAERWHTERLYRLSGSLWCYRPTSEKQAVHPEAPARTHGYVTFGSMNNIAKISETTVKMWSTVLRLMPESRLAMTNVTTAAADGMRERFSRYGVGRDRLQLEGRLETNAYRKLLTKVDIVLDTYPYNGTTTTCEMLWEGIPVVSLMGETSVSRSGYAILSLTDLKELVARNPKEYVAIAVGLASDLDQLEDIRKTLHRNVEKSALRDESGFTHDLETAYRNMWRSWCAESYA